jgi:hypothetical protein
VRICFTTLHGSASCFVGRCSIDVIEQRDADHYRSLRRIPTAAGARTSAISVALNLFCLGVPKRGREPAEIRVFQRQK